MKKIEINLDDLLYLIDKDDIIRYVDKHNWLPDLLKLYTLREVLDNFHHSDVCRYCDMIREEERERRRGYV